MARSDVAHNPADGVAPPESGVAQAPASEPRWLCFPADAPTGAAALQEWRNCFENSRHTGIHLHPDLTFLIIDPADPPPIIYARWNGGSRGPRHLLSMAVLTERRISIPLGLSLRPLRVLDNRVLGDSGPEALADFLDAAIELLVSERIDGLLFQDVEVDSPLWKALADAGRDSRVSLRYPSRPEPHWWIRFPRPPVDYWKQFSKKTRYNFRYRAKHLDHSTLCVREPQHVMEFLEKGRQLARQAWQFRRLGHSSSLENEQAWRRIAALGAMRCYLLENNGRTLAYASGFQWNGCFTFEETGYDPEFAAKSPGQVLLYRVIEDLIASDTPDVFDFGFGDADYKNVFSNAQTLSGPAMLIRRAWRPRLALAFDRFQRELGRRSRSVLRRLGMLTLLRQALRR